MDVRIRKWVTRWVPDALRCVELALCLPSPECAQVEAALGACAAGDQTGSPSTTEEIQHAVVAMGHLSKGFTTTLVNVKSPNLGQLLQVRCHCPTEASNGGMSSRTAAVAASTNGLGLLQFVASSDEQHPVWMHACKYPIYGHGHDSSVGGVWNGATHKKTRAYFAHVARACASTLNVCVRVLNLGLVHELRGRSCGSAKLLLR